LLFGIVGNEIVDIVLSQLLPPGQEGEINHRRNPHYFTTQPFD